MPENTNDLLPDLRPSLGATMAAELSRGASEEGYLDPPPFEFHNEHSSAPLTWLATVILRGCTEISIAVETITLC